MGGIELTKSPKGMAWTPVLFGELMAHSSPGADDADEDEDHPNQDDEMSEVFAQWKTDGGWLAHVRHDVVHDEVEEQSEGRHDESEAGEGRKRRPGREWLKRKRIVQWRTSGRVLLLTAPIIRSRPRHCQVFDQYPRAIE